MQHLAMSSELIKLQNQAVRPQQAQRPSVCKIESKVQSSVCPCIAISPGQADNFIFNVLCVHMIYHQGICISHNIFYSSLYYSISLCCTLCLFPQILYTYTFYLTNYLSKQRMQTKLTRRIHQSPSQKVVKSHADILL